MESIEEPVPLTAPQIAAEHFTRELLAHAHPDSAAETVVILHDACYGHRYSRLKTTKSTLSMIVERPERIHASVLGASTAYVRLGGHHGGANNAPHPSATEAASPPFKIRRTGRSMDITSSFVTNVHGTEWMSELRTMCDAAGEKIAAGAKELSRSATPTNPEKRKLHEGDLYLSPESLNAFQGALGGVAEAVDTVFAPGSQTKRAFVAVRPPGHHCSADHPSGFCWLNNVHVGIEYAAQVHGLTHAAILDFDLHHGDGSQAITWERNRKNNEKRLNAKPNSKLKLGPDIGYYSLHDINSYPCEMGDDEKVQAASLCIDNAHGQSIWNVHLQPWKTVDEFWLLYETRYRVLLDKTRRFLRHHTSKLRAEGKVTPRSAVFISAGFDASEWEGAGMQRHKVNVPTEFYARLTRDVVELAQEEDLECDGRVISVLEGGYSDRALCSGVLSHLSGLCGTSKDTALKSEASDTVQLDQMMRGLGIGGKALSVPLYYDREWWSAANLTALELKVNPPPPALGKKMRLGPQKTYATPTESFAYKVVDTDRFARSISGTMREVARPARPPTPPPPEVDWVIATQELSKLLIPTDRQTRSCMPDELAGVRTKKERMSAMPVLTSEESSKPRQLRDRKSKAPAYPESSHSDELESLRSVSRSSRRQTIADLPSSDQSEAQLQRRASRRLSASSALSSVTGDLGTAPPPVPKTRPTTATNGPSRPSTSSGPTVPVKKTRMPAPTKPKAPTVSSAPVSPKRSNKPPTTVSSSTTSNSINPTASSNNDVDDLASGLKKITLKVGTKEEHDRKQKEKVDGANRARALKAAETRKANAAAKKAAQENSGPAVKSKQPVMGATENTAPTSTLGGQNGMQHPGPPGALSHESVTAPTLQPIVPLPPPQTMAQGPVNSEAPTHPNPDLQQKYKYQFHYNTMSTSEHPRPYQQSLSQPQPRLWNNQPSAPLAPANDSPSNQLREESNDANPITSEVQESAPSQNRTPSTNNLPVWSAADPIRFSSATGTLQPTNSTLNSTGMNRPNGVSSVPQTANEMPTYTGTSKGGDALDAESKENSVWDVPVTPRH